MNCIRKKKFIFDIKKTLQNVLERQVDTLMFSRADTGKINFMSTAKVLFPFDLCVI